MVESLPVSGSVENKIWLKHVTQNSQFLVRFPVDIDLLLDSSHCEMFYSACNMYVTLIVEYFNTICTLVLGRQFSTVGSTTRSRAVGATNHNGHLVLSPEENVLLLFRTHHSFLLNQFK